MALLQLVAHGRQENFNGVRNLATRELIPSVPEIREADWGQRIRFTLHRDADILRGFNLSMRVGAAPQGYRWKRRWPFHFVKKLEFSIGGMIFWETGTAALEMGWLLHGLQRSPDWETKDTRFESLCTPAECIFDYNDEDRTLLSAAPHEICFEPLNLKSRILSKLVIPVVALAFHELRVQIQAGSLADCLEPIPGFVGQQAPMEVEMVWCKLMREMVFLDTEERRAIAQAQQGQHQFTTRHSMYCSDVFDVPANRELLTYIHAELLCSAAYIWITDEHDAELPSQIVDNIKVLFNGNTRHDFTGHQSRFIVRDELPHQTLPNTKSQNLYNISYFSGRVEENGIEQGANFSRLDNYSIKFNFSQAAPPRIKIHMIHRAQNTMRVMHGMAGLVFMLESFRISFQPVERPSRPLLSDYVKPEFQNTDQLIDVQEDDKTCLITYQDFEEGDIVQQCLNCKKVMTSSHLDTWYSHPDRRKDQKCIHCRQPYNANTFRKGKVHLVPKALAVVEAAAAVDADDVALLPQEKEPVQRQGILGRLFHMFGGGADHED